LLVTKVRKMTTEESTTGLAPVDKDDKWGYDLYPERRGDAPKAKWWQVALFGEGQVNKDRFKCERNVYYCFQNSIQNT
jgi:inner membrane protease ATP23